MEVLEEYVEVKEKAIDKVRQWMYYFIIGIISFVALVFLPMIGSTIGLGWNLPNTTVGWVVWVAVKLIIATINILIFHSFMCQAKLNVKTDPKFVEANDILGKVKLKKYLPRNPAKWNAQQYGRKGTIIFFTSALTVIALTQAMLTFDWMSMLTYLFTIVMGLIFGILQMKSAEDYWTDEYWKYAMMIKENHEQEERERKAKEEAARNIPDNLLQRREYSEQHKTEIQREDEKPLEMVKKESDNKTDVSIPANSRDNLLEPGMSVWAFGDNCKPVLLDCSGWDYSLLGGTRSNTCDTLTNTINVCSEGSVGSDKEVEE